MVVQAAAPFTVGSAISRSLSIWMKNIVPFSLLALLIYSPVILFALVMPVRIGNSVWLYTTVTGFLPLALNFLIGAAVAYGVFQQMRGQTVTLSDCVKVGLKRFLPVVGTGLLVGLVIFAGLIMLIVPAIIFACILYVATPAAVVEATSPVDSMKRSAFLTKGHRWTVFVISLVLGLISGAVGLIISMITPGPAAPTITPGADLSKILADTYAAMRTQTMISLVVGAVLGCLQSVATVVVYHDLRAQKEQIDLDKIVAVFA
jgi:hypothetical protein